MILFASRPVRRHADVSEPSTATGDPGHPGPAVLRSLAEPSRAGSAGLGAITNQVPTGLTVDAASS